jgi:hypothetical protein
MLKNIVQTVLSKLFTSGLLFISVVLSTQFLGASGRGEISLIMASSGIILLVNGLVGGSALVYLLPRYKDRLFVRRIVTINCCFSLIVSVAGVGIAVLAHSINAEFFFHAVFFTLLTCLVTTGLMFLLAVKDIFKFNLLSLLQAFFAVALFAFAVFGISNKTIEAYLFSSIFTRHTRQIGFSLLQVAFNGRGRVV